jgi:hypothetical protein
MGGIIGGVIGAAGSLPWRAERQVQRPYRLQLSVRTAPATRRRRHGLRKARRRGKPCGFGTFGRHAHHRSDQETVSHNYLNSTGYNFQREQGTGAITGSAAARGVLNSGATAKALMKYGNDLASTSFNNYLTQVNNLGAQGLTAAGQIGQAGTEGGKAAGEAMSKGIGGAAGSIAGLVNPLKSFFG